MIGPGGRDGAAAPSRAGARARRPRFAAPPLPLGHLHAPHGPHPPPCRRHPPAATCATPRPSPPTAAHCTPQGKYLVLFFYPLDFTFVCPTEIIAFSDRLAEFQEIGAAVVGVSVDSHFSHLAWINTPRAQGGLGGCAYPLLSDLTKQVAKDYEVLVEAGDNAGVALRGLFIISPDGTLRQKTVNDLPVGRSVDETLRLVKAFQARGRGVVWGGLGVECGAGRGRRDEGAAAKKSRAEGAGSSRSRRGAAGAA